LPVTRQRQQREAAQHEYAADGNQATLTETAHEHLDEQAVHHTADTKARENEADRGIAQIELMSEELTEIAEHAEEQKPFEPHGKQHDADSPDAEQPRIALERVHAAVYMDMHCGVPARNRKQQQTDDEE